MYGDSAEYYIDKPCFFISIILIFYIGKILYLLEQLDIQNLIGKAKHVKKIDFPVFLLFHTVSVSGTWPKKSNSKGNYTNEWK